MGSPFPEAGDRRCPGRRALQLSRCSMAGSCRGTRDRPHPEGPGFSEACGRWQVWNKSARGNSPFKQDYAGGTGVTVSCSRCVCVYVCVRVLTCVLVCAHACVHISVCLCACAHVCVSVHVLICMCVQVSISVHVCAHACECTCRCIPGRLCSCAYVSVCLCPVCARVHVCACVLCVCSVHPLSQETAGRELAVLSFPGTLAPKLSWPLALTLGLSHPSLLGPEPSPSPPRASCWSGTAGLL